MPLYREIGLGYPGENRKAELTMPEPTHTGPPNRRKSVDKIGKYVGPVARFAAGMAMLPPFLLIKQVLLKAILTISFAILALLSGKRLRWGYFLILLVSVCCFQLLFPWGKVIFELGPIVVTIGALESGLIRGLTLAGMVFLSVAAVRPELKFPGALGGLLGRTFYYFDSLFEGRRRLTRKNFFASLDKLLKERFDLDKKHAIIAKREGDRMRGWFMALPAALISWAFFIWAQVLDG